MASKRERKSSVWLEAQRILRDALKAPQLSINLAEGVDHPSAGIIPVVLVPKDNSGLVLLDGEDQLVKEPEFSVVSRVGVVDAGELMIADPVVNSVSELDLGGESGVLLVSSETGSVVRAVEASHVSPDAVVDGARSDPSAIGEDDDSEDDEESLWFGDFSCPSVEPFYFALPPSESVSKRGREVSRHDVAFVRGKPRLMALWKGESHLVFGIGGHLRTVIDWYEARRHDEASVAQWEPVADPARPDVPLYIEFTAAFGEENVAVGTVLKAEDKALVPWLFMCNSSRVGAGVNTQFFWCSTGPPVGFCTSVPIVCRVVVDNLPVGTELFFEVSAVREQYAWSVAANEFARDCIARLDAGEDPFIAQYGIERSRAVGLPWAYGGTPAVLSQYVKVGHGGHPEARGVVKAPGRHIAGEGKKEGFIIQFECGVCGCATGEVWASSRCWR